MNSEGQATGQERRKFTRVHFDVDVSLKQGERCLQCALIDISLNGLLVKTPEDYTFSADYPVEATIVLNADTEIQMTTEFVHASSNLLGFRCTTIDITSITHLRKLIELNMQEPEASERILTELLELHG